MSNLILKKMKLTKKQKIEFCKQQDETGILNFCSDNDVLSCYPNIVRSYRKKLHKCNDNLIKTCLWQIVVLTNRKQHYKGRTSAAALRRKQMNYADIKVQKIALCK